MTKKMSFDSWKRELVRKLTGKLIGSFEKNCGKMVTSDDSSLVVGWFTSFESMIEMIEG